jgi:glycosyltransferase involved in cell wall biosynthesis
VRIGHYYADLLEDGGCPSNVRFLSRAQLDRGHDVVGFGFDGPHASLLPEGLEVVTAPRHVFGLRSLIRQITLGPRRPDVLTVWGALIPGNELVLRAARRSGLATLLSLQGHLDPFLYRHGRRRSKRTYRRFALRPALERWTSDVHAQSPYEERLAVDMGFKGRSHVFPLGTPSATPPTSRPGPLRKELGLDKDSLLVGFFGRFDPLQKRFDALVAGLSMCRGLAERGEVTFVIAGKGDSRQMRDTKDIIEKHRMSGLIKMAGPFNGDDRFRALQDLDVLLHPSRYEGLPRVIRESAAVGTPAVVSLQANAELLVQAGGALLSDISAEALAQTFTRVIRDAEWRRNASRAAKLWADRNDWDACAANFEIAFEKSISASAA